MIIAAGITLIFNLLTILILLFGLFYQFENPKNKAVYGYVMAGGMIPYLILLSLYILLELAYKNSYSSAILILCILSPFVIGKLVTYETLKKYTFIQIICFSISAVFLALKYFI